VISRPSDLFEFKRGEVLVCDAIDPGMTFALEPEMVFKNRVSAGVESVFTVTETGTASSARSRSRSLFAENNRTICPTGPLVPPPFRIPFSRRL